MPECATTTSVESIPTQAEPKRPVVKPLPGGGSTAALHEDVGQVTCGSDSADFSARMLSTVASSLFAEGIPGSENHVNSQSQALAAAVAALSAFKPEDEIEGMLAAQAVAMHYASLECFRRVNRNQNPDVVSKLRKDGANLARGMTDMLAALDRKRGKGGQHIRVERVVVTDGGQAIVGSVNTDGPRRAGRKGTPRSVDGDRG